MLSTRESRDVRLRRYRTVLVSGWAQDREFSRLFGADLAIPLSDHCDFEELVRVVERSGADQVYTVHGFSQDLASIRAECTRAGLLPEDADLSMGMSDDFEIAVEEGATIVRLGTALFGRQA